MRRDYVERILDACSLTAKSGIDDLIDKSLITIKDDNILWMHDLVQEMGREIERSIKDLPRRLWNSEDVCCILKTNIGTASIEGMVLDMSDINEVHFNLAAFQNMYKLRLLKIFCSNELKKCEVCILGRDDDDLQFLPDSLRYLHWDGYPWKSFPSSFRPQYLVELNLPRSRVAKLWEGSLHLGSLKKIDLGYAENMTMLPDLSRASKLEHVYLEHCTSLREVPSYFQHLDDLKTLFLDGCSSVCEFPKLSKSIVCLVLSGTAIERVSSSSIKHLSCLEILSLNNCIKLKSVPNISKMKSLKAFRFEGSPVLCFESIDPRWIEKVLTPSQLSLRHCRYGDEIIRFFLHPLSKRKYVPELPFGLYLGLEMYVQTVLISIGGLWHILNQVHDQEILSADPDAENSFIKLRRKLFRPREFLLYNCLHLYGRSGRYKKMISTSVRKLQLLSKKIALQEFTSLQGLQILEDDDAIGVCCLGIEIPEWFHYQFARTRGGAKMNVVVELPPNTLNNPSFLGFAVCASVTISVRPLFRKYASGSGQKVELRCKPHFIMENGCKLSWDFTYSYDQFDCVTICTEDWEIVQEKITKVAFEFSLYPEKMHNVTWRINKCGIHLLYEEGAKEFGN